MTESDALTEALVGFARTLAGGYDVSDVLHELTGRVTSALGIAGAGVSLRRDGRMAFVTADSERIAALERVQEGRGEGPCTEALDTGKPVLVPALPERASHWPAYAAQAAELGIAAVAAIPLRNASRLGALDLYDTRRREWSAHDVSTGEVFSDIAGAYVLHASELDRERRTVEQLQGALDSRVVIEQAKGILAAENKISIDQAFALLRRHANDRNATLRAVAEAVVQLGLRP